MRVSRVFLFFVLLSLVVPIEASAFKYTHRVVISGEITDNWTTNDPASCGLNGSGSLTVSFTTKASTRIRPFISKFGGRPRSKKFGVWVLGVPGGGGVTHMGWRKADATIATVDNTVSGPNTDDPTQACPPPDKSGCGAKPMKGALVSASGWDRRYLYSGFSFPGSSFEYATTCRIAGLHSWTFPHDVAGGVNKYSDLLLRMPSPRSLKRQRTVAVSASDHTVSSSKRSENGTEVFNDDVLRKMTVTFTKL